MNKLDKTKFKNFARGLGVMMQIVFWMCVIGTLGSFIAGVIVAFVPNENFVGWNQFGISLDNIIRYQLTTTTESVSTKPILLSILFMAVVFFPGLGVIVHQLRDILNTVERDNPFAEENAKRIKVIGFIFLIGSIVTRIVVGLVAMVVVKTYNLTNLHVNFSVDGYMLISGLLLVLLAEIFRYGNYLQNEYDSTI